MINTRKFALMSTLILLVFITGIGDASSYVPEEPIIQSIIRIDQFSFTQQKSTPRDCEAILEDHPDLSSNYYIIDQDGESGHPPFEAYCDMITDGGGWTVIDYAYAADWQNYFTTWQVFDADRMVRPIGDGLPSPSWDYLVNWFTLADFETTFRVSPLCQSVVATEFLAQAYITTGNYYGCKWFNRNCDMDPVTQTCSTCIDDLGGLNAGTCSHLIRDAVNTGSWAIYSPYNFDCGFDWWNMAPSMGTNGQYCVAYRKNAGAMESFTIYLPYVGNVHKEGLPLYISAAIPWRSVLYPGEVFFTRTIQIPAELPPGGHFYLSSNPDSAELALVDDVLAVLWNTTDIFTFDFSNGGSPTPAIVEVPRSTLEKISGQLVAIEYRDKYAVAVSASPIWLIWQP